MQPESDTAPPVPSGPAAASDAVRRGGGELVRGAEPIIRLRVILPDSVALAASAEEALARLDAGDVRVDLALLDDARAAHAGPA